MCRVLIESMQVSEVIGFNDGSIAYLCACTSLLPQHVLHHVYTSGHTHVAYTAVAACFVSNLSVRIMICICSCCTCMRTTTAVTERPGADGDITWEQVS
jgi:hypothetical protein